MAFACHFRRASHSPKYLMTLLIFSFPTLLITLLAFLVDILVFIPDQSWGCWIVLVATILVMLCSIFTCAMRRTLVSRKARKKRIAEDQHMNGANSEGVFEGDYQSQLAKDPSVARESQYMRAESPPPLDGSQPSDKNPRFGTFESERSRPSTDDRAPLNQSHPGRDASIRTASTGAPRSQRSVTDPNRPPQLNTAVIDNYDNGRVSPVSPVGFDGPDAGYQRRTGPSPRGRGGPPPGYGRGRGGYPPPRGGWRGGPSRGGPRGGQRGMGSPRGGGPGQRGPPPNGDWYGGAAAGAVGGAAAGAMMMGERYHNRGPPRYQDDYPTNDPYADHAPYAYDRQGYGQHDPYAQQPQYYDQQPPYGAQQPAYGAQQPAYAPNVGAGQSAYPSQHNYQQPGYQPATPEPAQPLESQSPAQPSFNDEAVAYRGPVGVRRTPTASPAQGPGEISRSPASFGFNGPRPSPSNAANQPRNPPYAAESMPPMARDATPVGQAIEMDATSGNPLDDPGIAAAVGAGFNFDGREPRPAARDESVAESSPHRRKGSPHANLMLGGLGMSSASHTGQSPVEIDSTPRSPQATAVAPASRSTDAYYEDVDPRFAAQDEPPPSFQHPRARSVAHAQSPSAAAPEYLPAPSGGLLPHEHSASSFYSAGGDGDPTGRTRSPGAASDNSNFTSVSQRGVNPAWNGVAGPVGSYGPPRPRAEDAALRVNPDFALPSAGAKGHARGGSAGGSHHYPAM